MYYLFQYNRIMTILRTIINKYKIIFNLFICIQINLVTHIKMHSTNK